MLTKRTVLVLGAGSSAEFGLPVGETLAKNIAQKLDFYHDAGQLVQGDSAIFSAFRADDAHHINDYAMAGRLIAQGLPLSRSIDDFLYIHGSNAAAVTAGKAGIVACILEAERASRIYWNREGSRAASVAEFHRLRDTWLYKLFRFLWTDVRLEDAAQVFDGLSIINFNYDRCVEHFLLTAVQLAYSISQEEAGQIVGRLDIVHPYGQVGFLPTQGLGTPRVEFGGTGNEVRSLDLARSIKTFTEQAHDQDEVEGWRERLRQADEIVFLGFAFHRQNMELLQVEPRPEGPWPMVYATALGTSGQDQRVFLRRIELVRGQPPAAYSRPDLSMDPCAEFIERYGLLLFG